jgi:histidinol dehydrogenase
MRVRRFEWEGAGETATAIRAWSGGSAPAVDVSEIAREVRQGGDEALLRLTNRFDASEVPRKSLLVEPSEAEAALAALDPALRESLDLAATNIRAVAEAQLPQVQRVAALSEPQNVAVREVAVGAAGIYAPGGRAAYPSSVLMCAIPARVAGVTRIALASPPGPDGAIHPLVLAAAALCEVAEIYAMGGAQAIFALAYGTEAIAPVDVVAGPGNAWVREAKRAVSGAVGIDSLAGPSELMVIAGSDTDPEWAALDLCAQAEHGAEGPLVAASPGKAILNAIADAVERIVEERDGIGDAPLALVQAPGLDAAIGLANAFAPEHLELMVDDAAALADRVTTAGCVFVGPYGATAFGD